MKAIIQKSVGAAIVLLAGLWVGPGAVAQSIQGTVSDPDGCVVAKARVMLMQDYVKLKEIAADEKGDFSFADLTPGRYQVQVKQPMFSLFQQTVELKGKERVMVYAILPLGRMSDDIRINARLAPAVQRNPVQAQRTVREGGKVELAKAIQFRMPEYPPGPDSRGVEGDVVIFATIKSDGSITDPVIISSPDPEFDGDAIAAVKKWRYQPMKLNDHPVDTTVTVTLQFRLQ